ncbi:MAG: hypothetical protein ABSE51_05155 [Terracidiphilus sp.]|jgi:hypothetical protein
MKHLLWIPIAIVLLPSAARSQALPDNPQPAKPAATGWSRVADLAHDEEIVVAGAGSHDLHCRFAGATDDYLFCNSNFPWINDRGYQLDRAEIETIRLNQSHRNLKITVGTAAAASGVWAGIRTANHDNASTAVFTGIFGTGIGALAGLVVAIPVEILVPGRLIYRQPPPKRNARSSVEPLPAQDKSDALVSKVSTTSQSH